MGGDTIVVCNPTPSIDPTKRVPRPASGTDRLAGPESPLVVYGDTSQDGVWYGGQPCEREGLRVRAEAVRSVLQDPGSQNEDDEWVFPLADPFDDSPATTSSTRATCSPGSRATAPAAPLPTVGFTAYGGAGNDLIIGSQAGDHLAGGSGDDTILGLRGVDHIYGDSGFNVDILTRGADRHLRRTPARAPTLDKRNPRGRPDDQAGAVARTPTRWTPAAT